MEMNNLTFFETKSVILLIKIFHNGTQKHDIRIEYRFTLKIKMKTFAGGQNTLCN